jgi:hypothetical protein
MSIKRDLGLKLQKTRNPLFKQAALARFNRRSGHYRDFTHEFTQVMSSSDFPIRKAVHVHSTGDDTQQMASTARRLFKSFGSVLLKDAGDPNTDFYKLLQNLRNIGWSREKVCEAVGMTLEQLDEFGL